MTIASAYAAGSALTIVSFDSDADQAEREVEQERSLNLALRRRRIRSEILRIPLDANESVRAFLADVVAALSGRRLLLLVRELPQYPGARALIEQLCELGESVLVVIIGSLDRPFEHASAEFLHIESDSKEEIEALADMLVCA